MPTALRKLVNSRGQIYYQSVHYKAPTVLRREGTCLVFSFEYSAKMVTRLKAAIPWKKRCYRPDMLDWLIYPEYGETIIQLVKEVLGEEISISKEEP